MDRICTHPNVAAVLLLSLGCESFNKYSLSHTIAESGHQVATLTIQDNGGILSSISNGIEWVSQRLNEIIHVPRVPMDPDELIIGTICGGSDGTSGITGNPAAGLAFDRLLHAGAACVFEETGELIGCEDIMASRAVTPEFGDELRASATKAARYYATLRYGSLAPGNADRGLSTIEEKSMGAYAKSGSSPISGLIKPGDIPPKGGLYLMDGVPDGEGHDEMKKWDIPCSKSTAILRMPTCNYVVICALIASQVIPVNGWCSSAS